MPIQIQTGPAPVLRIKSTKAAALSETFEAAQRLQPGQWFTVPDTAGLKPQKTSGIRRVLTRFAEAEKLDLEIAHTQGDKGVLVRHREQPEPGTIVRGNPPPHLAEPPLLSQRSPLNSTAFRPEPPAKPAAPAAPAPPPPPHISEDPVPRRIAAKRSMGNPGAS